MASVKVLLNVYKKNKKGEHPLIIQVIHKRKKRILSLGHYLLPNQWNQDDQLVIEKSKVKEQKLYFKKLNSIIANKKSSVLKALVDLEELGKPFTIDEIFDKIKEKKNLTTVFIYWDGLVGKFKDTGRTGNSQFYKNALSAFKLYREEKDLSFDELTYKVVIGFEDYLFKRNRKKNTVAGYMKSLRAMFNYAMKEGYAKRDQYPFYDYKISVEKTIKRALEKSDISKIRNLDLTERPVLVLSRDLFIFSFYCRGMSFVDIAHLKVRNIVGERLFYARNKTQQKFTIRLTQPMFEIIKRYNELTDPNTYVFPIIKDEKGDIFWQYRKGLEMINRKLKTIGELANLPIPLTTYVSRHSWATIAKREGVPTAVISEGLGHETERTTQIYLDSFENDVLDDANDLITNI